MADWIKYWVGPIVAPVNLLLGPTGAPHPGPTWIQLPGAAGTSVTIVNGEGETVVLTSTSKLNTWPAGGARQITSSTSSVNAGTGPIPPIQITGADGDANLFTPTTAGNWDVVPATVQAALDELAGELNAAQATIITHTTAIATNLTDQTSIQAQVEIDLGSALSLATGALLAVFANGASSVPGTEVTDAKTRVIRWNNHATPGAIVVGCAKPQDLDEGANVVAHYLVSKVGATLADATTITMTAYEQNVAALHDFDADFGGATGAVTGDAASKTVTELTRALAHANVSGPPGAWTFGVKPTDGTLGTDDFLLHRMWLEYKRLPRTA